MFVFTPARAILPRNALKAAYPVPADQPDRFADLLAQLALRDIPTADAA